jgi:hypothetical protein
MDLAQAAQKLSNGLKLVVGSLEATIANGCPEGCVVYDITFDAQEAINAFTQWFNKEDE